MKPSKDQSPAPAPIETRWSAKVDSYFSTYPYRCQACGLDGEQRPEGTNTGPIKVYRLEEGYYPGDEPNHTLVALCASCNTEMRYISRQTEEPFEDVVARFTFRQRAATSRRRHLISKQAQERRHKRARTQEYKEKLAGHIERYKTEGIPIPREFVYEYADVHRR